jgi:choline dehydrogenase-like flavoprotein
VIVVGSGIGGGILADQLSDLNLNVLVLEAGSYLFPTHIANLPRQHQIGQFDKHVWGLWDEFQIRPTRMVRGASISVPRDLTWGDDPSFGAG